MAQEKLVEGRDKKDNGKGSEEMRENRGAKEEWRRVKNDLCALIAHATHDSFFSHLQ